MSDETNEKAVAPRGLGMGGLGDFDADSFKEALGDTGKQKGTATGDDVRAAMGNQLPKMPRLKVKHGGAAIFKTDDGETVQELVGVIVAHTRSNTYFGKSFDDREEGEKPPCYSNNGVDIAEQAEDPQNPPGCHTCNRNRDARDKVARDHAFGLDRDDACNNYLTLAFARLGEEVPYSVRFSSGTFKAWAAYVQDIAAKGRYQPHEVGTRITLISKIGAGGSEFSVGKFELLGSLPPEMAASYRKDHRNYEALLQRTAADNTEDEAGAAASAVKDAKAAEAAAAQGEAAL